MCCFSGKTDKHANVTLDEYRFSCVTLLKSKVSGKVQPRPAEYCTGSHPLRWELSHDLLFSLSRDLSAHDETSAHDVTSADGSNWSLGPDDVVSGT